MFKFKIINKIFVIELIWENRLISKCIKHRLNNNSFTFIIIITQ